ncbi:surface lipoprotein assembly modifier [Lysobacter enzymogenes]|uniref:surface lipoprotein assembly modifier n=1 Tax=Lysobacter enzymogenes TaxID=69 RepID=UPI00384F5660
MTRPRLFSSATGFAAGLALCLFCPAAPAQDRDDTRLRLDHGLEQRQSERERALLEEENAARTDTDAPGEAELRDPDALAAAIYRAVSARQWPQARALLQRYRALPQPDRMLELYAQGALARADGDLDRAERDYRALLELQSDFLPAQLELARVLFENQLDREAERSFQAIAAALDAGDAKTAGVRRTVDTFLRALRNRRGWHGSVALGPTWNDNINQSSASRTCLLAAPDGHCAIERSLPAAIRGGGLDYDASLTRREPLRGHHGLYLRSLLYGYSYRDRSAFNETTWTSSAGWSYADARHAFTAAPQFEYAAFGNRSLYAAWGARADWTWTISPRWLFKLEGDYKRMRYRRQDLAGYDGPTSAVYATVWRALPQRWMLFGGLDLARRETRRDTEAYLQRGARLGLSKQFDAGVSLLLFGSLRKRGHDRWNETFQARRRDEELNATAIVRVPRWAFAGFVPSLTYKHNHTDSSIDWLYGYDRDTVSLKLERAF